MADTKSKNKKTVKLIKKLRPDTSKAKEISATISDLESEIKEVKGNRFGFVFKLILVAILGTVIYLLAVRYRGLILAGTVNNSPITRFELNSKMAEKYGKQALDEIINERLLVSELKKNNIVISEKELSGELAKLVTQYGGQEAFNTAIAQFGLTEAKAKDSVRQSLGFKKLVEKNYKIDITAEAVKKYFDENKTTFVGKKFEEVSSEIKDNLYQQEIYTKSQEWFANVRKAAKISTFIK